MGLFNSNYKTIKVSGMLNPVIGKNVEEKKLEAIDQMNAQGFTLASCTCENTSSGGFIGGLRGTTICYTLVFKKN